MAGEVHDMPITIWKPREYATGFADNGAEGGYLPDNGEVAATPYNRDTKIREVTRYTGSTTRRYRDYGEFEMTIPQGYVEPSDVKAGYLATIEDAVYMIEDYTWELTESGYECTISGRDLGALLDRHIPTHRRESGMVSAQNMGNVVSFLEKFFTSYFVYSDDINLALPERCGWFRDTERKPADGWVIVSGETEGDTGASSAEFELMSYGAWLRIVAAYRDMGYRFNVPFNETLGLHTVQLELYKPSPTDTQEILLKSDGRGVSGFSYSYETREAVNAAFVIAKSRWVNVYGVGWEQAEDPIHTTYLLPFERNGANWAEVANDWSGIAIDLGEAPADQDAAAGDAIAWMRDQMGDIYTNPVTTVEFSYDNSGAYKYGQHFGLGSIIHLADEYTGIGVTARLMGVTTKYEAGASKGYDFVFGDERLTQADKLKRKFSYIDRKTYSI